MTNRSLARRAALCMLVAASACTAPPRPAPPPLAGSLRLHSNGARDLQRSLELGLREQPLSANARDLVALLARAARTQDAVALAEIDVATANSGARRRFAFDEVRAHRADVEARLERLDALFLRRRDALVARAEHWLPAAVRAQSSVDVVAAIGLREPCAALMRAANGDARWLVDVLALMPAVPGDSGDEFEERASAAIVHGLVLAALESDAARSLAWNARPEASSARAFRDAVVDAAIRPQAQRFDDQGRRTPEFDLRARDRVAAFAQSLRALGSPSVVQENAITHRERFDGFAVGGTPAAVMSDVLLAIEVFAGPDAARAAVADGPGALFAHYAELSGRAATLPPVPTDAASLWLEWITAP